MFVAIVGMKQLFNLEVYVGFLFTFILFYIEVHFTCSISWVLTIIFPHTTITQTRIHHTTSESSLNVLLKWLPDSPPSHGHGQSMFWFLVSHFPHIYMYAFACFGTCYKWNHIVYTLSVCIWLLLHKIIYLRFVHVPFYFWVIFHYIQTLQLVCSFYCRIFGLFPVSLWIRQLSISLLWTYVFMYLGKYLWVELLGNGLDDIPYFKKLLEYFIHKVLFFVYSSMNFHTYIFV